MTIPDPVARAMRSAHQARHGWRTRLARRRPRRLADGVFSPVGVPSEPRKPSLTAGGGELRRRDIVAAREAEAVRMPPSGGWDLAVLCAAGAIATGTIRPADELSAYVSSIDPDDVADHERRERIGVELRRRAWRVLRPDRPTVSVLLATARPADAAHAAAQLGRQERVHFQLIVGLHGSAWRDDDDAPFRSVADDVLVVPFVDAATLGEVLSDLAARADGELITKWDDDDYYGPHHLEDLVTAYLHSDADLVGRGGDFVHLAASDTTIRRAGRAEAYDRHLAGGTLLMRRDRLDEVGGWGSLPRHVDLDIIDRVHRAGGWTYRTHPFGYVLRRRQSASVRHTWDIGDEYFRSSAIAERPGLDLRFAGVEP